MQKRPDEESARQAQNRLQSFLDCIAQLLARRWLRECRQQQEEKPQEKHRPHDERDGK
jgi:hypothetical protein